MADDVVLVDNSDLVLKDLDLAILKSLEEIGQRATGYAKMECPVGTPESTGIENYHGGSLRQSLTYKVAGNEVYVGTNLKVNGSPYGVYVEFGTGVHASKHNGRRSPWTWKDKNGKFHFTRGIKPRHFLRNAVQKHRKELLKVFEKNLKGE